MLHDKHLLPPVRVSINKKKLYIWQHQTGCRTALLRNIEHNRLSFSKYNERQDLDHKVR